MTKTEEECNLKSNLIDKQVPKSEFNNSMLRVLHSLNEAEQQASLDQKPLFNDE